MSVFEENWVANKVCGEYSVRDIFEATDDYLTFLGTVPDYEGSCDSSKTYALGSETKSLETKNLIINIIRHAPYMIAAEIAMQLNMSSREKKKKKG